MNRNETIDLLTACAAYDRRTIGESDIAAWHAALRDMSIDEALLAVPEWYGKRTTDQWTMPNHIRNTARDMARAAAERAHNERILADSRALPAPAVNPNFDGLPIADAAGPPVDAAYDVDGAIAIECPRCGARPECYCVSPIRPDRPQKIPCLARLRAGRQARMVSDGNHT